MNKDKVKAKVLSNLDKLKAAGKERKGAFNKGYKTGRKLLLKVIV